MMILARKNLNKDKSEKGRTANLEKKNLNTDNREQEKSEK